MSVQSIAWRFLDFLGGVMEDGKAWHILASKDLEEWKRAENGWLIELYREEF